MEQGIYIHRKLVQDHSFQADIFHYRHKGLLHTCQVDNFLPKIHQGILQYFRSRKKMILQSVVYHITVSILGNFTPVKVTINSPKPSRATLIANNFSYIIPYKQAFSIIQARLWFKRNQCIYCMVNFF